MKESVADGRLRPCAHLKMAKYPQSYIARQSGGYGPVCERDSFQSQQIHEGWTSHYNFYGCPSDCLVFQEDRRPNAPWNPALPKSANPHGSEQRSGDSASRGVKIAAWIGFAGVVVAALIGAGATLWKGKEDTRKTETVTSTRVETQQSQPVQKSSGSTQQSQPVQSSPGTTNIQVGRDVIINNAPAQNDQPLREREALSETLAVQLLPGPRKDTPSVTVLLNGSETEVKLGRTYRYLFFDPPRRAVTNDELPLTLRVPELGEMVVRRFTERGVVLDGRRARSLNVRIYIME
jgi:hypothetical protein